MMAQNKLFNTQLDLDIANPNIISIGSCEKVINGFGDFTYTIKVLNTSFIRYFSTLGGVAYLDTYYA